MVQPGTRRHQKERKELARKDSRKVEAVADFLSVYPYKMETVVEE
jgi:hypothetical protein